MEFKIDYNKNYYKLLGVSENATENEIKIAYHNEIKKYANDNNNNVTSDVANMLKKMCQDIIEAKEVLLNGELRKKYDENLKKFNNQENEEDKQAKFREYVEKKLKEDEKRKQFYETAEQERKKREVEKEQESQKQAEKINEKQKPIAYMMILMQIIFYLLCGGGTIPYLTGLFTIGMMIRYSKDCYWEYSFPTLIAILNVLHIVVVGFVTMGNHQYNNSYYSFTLKYLFVETIIHFIMTAIHNKINERKIKNESI